MARIQPHRGQLRKIPLQKPVGEVTASAIDEQPSLRVTDIGEYVRFHSCDRRFKLKLNNYELAKKLPFSELMFETLLDPVLAEAGRLREGEWETSLQQSNLLDLTQYSLRSRLDPTAEHLETSWNDFVQTLQALSPGQQAYGREISIEATIRAFALRGQIDFVVVLWDNHQPRLRLVECKASRKDRTYHQVQLALYWLMVRQLVQINPVMIRRHCTKR